MNTTVFPRKQASFRLRTDLLEALREKAIRCNRTLNNYVESVLLTDAFDRPNDVTLAAMKEVEAKRDDKSRESYASADELFKAIL